MVGKLGTAVAVLAAAWLQIACAQPAAAPAPTVAGEPTKPPERAVVRVGLQGGASDAAAFVAEGKGYFREQGIEFELVPFSAPPAMVPALATSQIDVAGVGPNPQYVNAVARDVPIRAVADKGRLSPGNGYLALVVRRALVDDGRYHGPADLKGLRIALAPPAMTSPNAISLDVMLRQAGLTLDDVELIDLPIADMPASLVGGSIDAGLISEPQVSRIVEQGAGVRMLGMDEVSPDQQISAISFSPAFLQERPDVGRRFTIAYLKGARDYNDAFRKNQGKPEIIRLLAQATTVKDEAVWEKAVPPGINPDGYVNAENLKYQMDWYFRHGQINEQRPVEEMVDNQFVDYAIGVLGRYR